MRKQTAWVQFVNASPDAHVPPIYTCVLCPLYSKSIEMYSKGSEGKRTAEQLASESRRASALFDQNEYSSYLQSS